MSVSQQFGDFISEQLSAAGDISMRRMFGGVGIYVDGYFCALISGVDETLYFKVDSNSREDYLKEGMSAFSPYKDKSKKMNYYEVPAHILDNRRELCLWVEKARKAAQNS